MRLAFCFLLIALPFLIGAGCDEDEVAKPTPRVCTDPVAGTVTPAGSPLHVHLVDDICEEDRGSGIPFQFGTDHVHTVNFTPQEVEDVLDGAYTSKTTSIANGHSHAVRFND